MNLPEGYSLQNAKYRLTKVIGQGGFGITYLGVWNTEVKGNLGTVKTEVPVCIKEYFFKDYCYRDTNTQQVLVHSETGRQLFDKFKEKLIKEAKILSDVHHPFIVNVLEVFEENNTAYIAMEHIAGCSLKYMLDVEGILPENKVLRYISQIGQALEFVHQKHILHLDIKPSNILIDKKNNARLIDFGVSKRYDIEQKETSTTMLTLSKGFAPIEQYDNEGTQSFSPCPDIYSLGATMYNLLTGEVPTESILRVAKPLVKPSEINKEITPKTENVIITAMQVNPIHRYQSVQAMLNELDLPSYFEDTSNTLIEDTDYQSKNKDEDETELRSDTNTPQPVDNEQTLVRQPEEDTNRDIRKKKSKRRIIIPLLIFFVAFLGCGVAYIMNMDGTQGANEIDDLLAGLQGNSEITTNENTDLTGVIPPATDNQGVITTNTQPAEPTRTDANNRTDTRITQENPNTPPNNTANTLSPEERDAQHNAYLASAQTKITQKKFTEAREDLDKASELKSSQKLIELLMDLKTVEEAERIIKQKDLYEEHMPFGELTIVKEKATSLWGAYDNNGKIIIPCQYLGISPYKNDKAFERREGGLYDVYDNKGVLRLPALDWRALINN